MYEMYPEDWTAGVDRSPASPNARPRRRARKEHSVVPVVLIHVAEPTKVSPLT